jgi:glycosyltransferase involved in cell wall biosynthesis
VVVHLSFSGRYYGRESAAFSLVKALQSSIDVMMLLVVENRNGAQNNQLLIEKMQGFAIQHEIVGTDAAFSRDTLQKLYQVLSGREVSLIHCHCFKSVVYSLLMRRQYKQNFKIVFTLHGLILPFNVKSLVFKAINLLSVALSDGIIGCTHKYLPLITKLPFLRAKTTVILNAYQGESGSPCSRGSARALLESSCGALDQKIVVAFIGRFTAVKNPLLFLRAASQISRSPAGGLPPVHFIMVGDGELRAEMESFIAADNLAAQVTLLGYVPDMSSIYPAIDIVLMTSDIEGIPMCILESMSHSIPVLAPAVGGIPEIIRHDETGLLFSRRNLSQCAGLLTSLVQSAELRQRLGKNGREELEIKFCYAKSISRHLQFYQRVLPDKSRLARGQAA